MTISKTGTKNIFVDKSSTEIRTQHSQLYRFLESPQIIHVKKHIISISSQILIPKTSKLPGSTITAYTGSKIGFQSQLAYFVTVVPIVAIEQKRTPLSVVSCCRFGPLQLPRPRCHRHHHRGLIRTSWIFYRGYRGESDQAEVIWNQFAAEGVNFRAKNWIDRWHPDFQSNSAQLVQRQLR